MYYRVKLLPARERTLRRFTAPNPWNGKPVEEWSVEQFQMVPKTAVKRGVTPAMTCRPGTPAAVKGNYGLRSDSDGSIQMFPVSLTKAWVQKEVPDGALPEVLHKLPKLKRTDFEQPLAVTFQLWVAAFCLGLAAMILPGALHSSEHGMQEMSAEQFRSEPQPLGRAVRATGEIVPDGVAPYPYPVSIPAGMVSYMYQKAGNVPGKGAVVWFSASGGHRMALIEPATGVYAKNGFRPYGTTVAPDAVGMPAQFVQELKTKVPDLDTSLVFAETIEPESGSDSTGGQVMAWFAAFMAAIGLALLAVALRRKRRYTKIYGEVKRLAGYPLPHTT
jgi:LPXTG-motif cell wall-anchored protein